MSLCKELRTELVAWIVSTRLQTVMKSASLLMGTWVHTQPPPQGPANETPAKWRLSPREEPGNTAPSSSARPSGSRVQEARP